MANEEHLKILKQGVDVWNVWRAKKVRKHSRLHPDLIGTDLSVRLIGRDLLRANFRRADLSRADLAGEDIRGADLCRADLRYADLRDALLSHALLSQALLSHALLSGADLSGADLRGADLTGADLKNALLSGTFLRGADLRGADLRRGNLRDAHLTGAHLRNTRFGNTVLSFCDLWIAKGLKSIRHSGPSTLGIDVLQKSQGQLPAIFLKGCGLSDWEIEAAKLHNPNLTEDERTAITYEILRIQGQQPIQLNPLFVSYSSKDAPFVEAVEARLDKMGVRYWRDVHDLKAGRLETQIDRAIRLNPTVLLVLSKDSVESDWVEWEVGQARKLEKELKRDVLCPVALDDAWKTCSWEGPLRKQIQKYHILDFSAWDDERSLEQQFGRLLEGLKLFYRPKE